MSANFGILRRRVTVGVVAALAAVTTWAALAAAVEPAVRGRITGYLSLTSAGWKDARDPSRHGYSFREPVLTVPAEHRRQYPILPSEVVVALLGDPAGAERAPVKLRLGGGRVSQATIVVRPGTSVEFHNRDPFVHRLYAVGQQSFPPNETAIDGKREWKVPDEGVYEIRDEVAPNLRMWIVSEPNAIGMVAPDLDGGFRLPAPEGEFQVQVFFGGNAVSVPRPLSMKLRDVDWSRAPIPVKAPKKEKEEKSEAEGTPEGGEKK